MQYRSQYHVLWVRLVLDTAAMVAAIRSDTGVSRRSLVAALDRRSTLLVSEALLVECQAVMTRAEHLAASKLSTDDVFVLLDALPLFAHPYALHPRGDRR
jgi:hypothetical protein